MKLNFMWILLYLI